MNIVIHHNPGCDTSRDVPAIIEAARYRPTVIEYLKTGWARPQLLGLFAAADLTPRWLELAVERDVPRRRCLLCRTG